MPLSLIGTFAVLYELGYSLDNLSLMALSIAVGFVVDDAVVVIENIVRHMEGGASPFEAALKGAGEIGFTIVSITLSLIAVFIPLFLMSGYVGLLFREFAVTVSVALVLSLVISLTLTPMMCARLLKAESKAAWPALPVFRTRLRRPARRLRGGLKVVLRHRFVTLMVMLGTIALTGYLYVVIPKGFFPQQDTGMIIGLSEAAQDISFQAMTQRQQALIDAVMRDPAVASVGSAIGAGGGTTTVNNGRMFIALKPQSERVAGRSGDRAAAHQPRQDPGHHALHAGRAGHHDRRARVARPSINTPWTTPIPASSTIGRRSSSTRSERYRGSSTSPPISSMPGRCSISPSSATSPSSFGILPSAIDNTLDDAFGQRIVSTMFTTLNQYHVVLEVEPQFQYGPEALNSIYVSSSSGQQVPLGHPGRQRRPRWRRSSSTIRASSRR